MVNAWGDQPMPLMAKTSGRRRVNQRRHLATDAVALRLQQIQAETHSRRRINGVAALLHDAEPGGGGQIMPEVTTPCVPIITGRVVNPAIVFLPFHVAGNVSRLSLQLHK